MTHDPVARHFDHVAPGYDRWKRKAHYYYGSLKSLLASSIPTGARVAEVGCGTGDLLASLSPEDGLGLDISPEMVALAAAKHPQLRFAVHDVVGGPWPERFPFVVAADVAEHLTDLDAGMAGLAGMLEQDGLLVLTTANPLWSAPLHLAERLRLKMPEGGHEWRTREDLLGAATGAGLRLSSFERDFLIPKAVPGLKRLNTAAIAGPLRRRLGLIQLATFTTAS